MQECRTPAQLATHMRRDTPVPRPLRAPPQYPQSSEYYTRTFGDARSLRHREPGPRAASGEGRCGCGNAPAEFRSGLGERGVCGEVARRRGVCRLNKRRKNTEKNNLYLFLGQATWHIRSTPTDSLAISVSHTGMNNRVGTCRGGEWRGRRRLLTFSRDPRARRRHGHLSDVMAPGDDIDTLVFDLDGTLYAIENGYEHACRDRVFEFMVQKLGVASVAAAKELW